jgi:uncharacterized protein
MRRHLAAPALAAALALLAGTARAAADGAPPPRPAPPAAAAGAASPTVRVTGEGRVRVAPDVALATVAVTAVDPSLAKATRDTTEASRKVLDALAQAGVAKNDLQTSRYDVQIERRAPKSSEPPRITGYRVTNAVRVKVRDLSRLGAILDRVVAAGANELEGLSFVKDDPSAERGKALAAAVHDARARAEEIARAAGMRLGPVLEVVEGGRPPGPVPMPGRMMAMADASVPVESGEVEIAARVEVLYALQ